METCKIHPSIFNIIYEDYFDKNNLNKTIPIDALGKLIRIFRDFYEIFYIENKISIGDGNLVFKCVII